MSEKFGKYFLQGEIARGAMGIVYRARLASLPGRSVALKVLQDALSNDAEHVERFRREAQALARVDHPNIVKVHDFGDVGGQFYFTMELLEGGKTLEDLVDAGPLELPRAAALMAAVVRAVAHLHSRGVLHRDLKLTNVLVTGEGVPKLSDFGLARLLDRATRITGVGDQLGTPLYMAPEQFLGATEIDARADVYGLGVMLFRLVTKAYPFEAKSAVELFAKVLNESPRWPPTAPASADLRAVCEKAFAREVDERYPTALAFAQDLDALASGAPVRAKPPSRARKARAALRRHSRSLFAVAAVLVAALVVLGGRELRRLGGGEDLAALRDAVAELERPPRARRARELLAAFTKAEEAIRAARASGEASAERAKLGDRLAVLGTDHAVAAAQEFRERGPLVASAAEELARARHPFERGALAELLAVLERASALAADASHREKLALARAEVLVLAGRPEAAHAALLAGGVATTSGEALLIGRLHDGAPPGASGPLAALAVIRKNESVAHVATDALAIFAAIDLERVAELPESSFASLTLALSVTDKVDARSLWLAIAREPCRVEVSPGVTATASLRSVVALARARASAERLDGASAVACAEDAVAATGDAPLLSASAHLLLARARRAEGDLDAARSEESAARAALRAAKDDPRAASLATVLESAEQRTKALADLGGASSIASDDERTLDLVAESATELAIAEAGVSGLAGIERARRAAGLALERQPGSAPALAALARVEVARAGATGSGSERAFALAGTAVARSRSAVALEALAGAYALRGDLAGADERFESAAAALEANDRRTLVRDAELVALRRRAAHTLAAEPRRALRHLLAAIDRLSKDAVHLVLRVGLHAEALELAGRAEERAERDRQEALARTARGELASLRDATRRVCASIVSLRNSSSPAMVADQAGVRKTARDLGEETDRILRAGHDDPLLLFWDRELTTIVQGDALKGFGQLSMACELDEELFHWEVVRIAVSQILESAAEAFSGLADDARSVATDVRASLPHGADADLVEAVVVANGALEIPGSIFDGQRGLAASRRYVRRHPTVRAGRFFHARLLLSKGHVAEAELEIQRALDLPALVDNASGANGGRGCMKLLTRADVLLARHDRAGFKKVFREAIEAGLKLNEKVVDSRYAEAELSESERRELIGAR